MEKILVVPSPVEQIDAERRTRKPKKKELPTFHSNCIQMAIDLNKHSLSSNKEEPVNLALNNNSKTSLEPKVEYLK